MKTSINRIYEKLRSRQNRRLLTRFVSITAAVVVFITTYALVLPAITMEEEALCGILAHQHDDTCYERMLVCGLEESEDHEHTEDCYEEVLICGLEAHTHSEACYEAAEESADFEETEITEGLNSTAAVTSDLSYGDDLSYEDDLSFEENSFEGDSLSDGETMSVGDSLSLEENASAEGSLSVEESASVEDSLSDEAAASIEDGIEDGMSDMSDLSDMSMEGNLSVGDSLSMEGSLSVEDGLSTEDDLSIEDGASDLDTMSVEGNISQQMTDMELTDAEQTDGQDSGSQDDDQADNGYADDEYADSHEGSDDDSLQEDFEEEGQDNGDASVSGDELNADTPDSAESLDAADSTDPAEADAGADDKTSADEDETAYTDAEGDNAGNSDNAEGTAAENPDTADAQSTDADAGDAAPTDTAANADTNTTNTGKETGTVTYTDTAAGTGSSGAAAVVPENSAIAQTGGISQAENTYTPVLDTIDFNRALTNSTGIYYHKASDGEAITDSLAVTDWKKMDDAAKDDNDEKESLLAPGDLIRIYLSYTIPAGSLNATNPAARYRLPSNLHLTDRQVEAINQTENGISKSYVDLNTLEITDLEKHAAYLGLEAVEGSRNPSDDREKYLAEHPEQDGTECVSATVKVENVFDLDESGRGSGKLIGQDLIITFSPYTIEKNRHGYDAGGQPTKAGETVNGWLTLDFNMQQVDWITTDTDTDVRMEDAGATDGENAEQADAEAADGENAEQTDAEATDAMSEDQEDSADTVAQNAEQANAEDTDAQTSDQVDTADKAETSDTKIDEAKNDEKKEVSEDKNTAGQQVVKKTITTTVRKKAKIVFAEKVKEDKKLGIKGADEISTTLQMKEVSVEETEAYEKDKSQEDKSQEDKSQKAEKDDEQSSVRMPAVIFDQSIFVQGGKLGSDTDTMETAAETTTIKVHVEADEGTFPEGTTMVLANVTGDDLDSVAEAVENAVTSNDSVSNKTRGFHAVDISFRDANGKEIEPLKQIRVSMTSDAIKAAVEDKTTAPVVVHVEEEPTVIETKEESSADLRKEENEDKEAEKDIDEEKETEKENENETEKNTGKETGNEAADTLTFDADSFSIYAIVYTVDFHYEVDGEEFECSIPGGGFISFTELAEILGILEYTDYDDAADFVAQVETMEFSSPELVWVGKAADEMTVGALKEANGLESEYSAELTEEDIEFINAQTVEAGDWALISLKPFQTVETLTVIMKNGDVFTIKLTDDAYSYEVVSPSNLNGQTVVIFNQRRNNAVLGKKHTQGNPSRLMAAPVTRTNSTISSAVSLTEWTFTRVGNTGNNYTIRGDAGYLNINNSNVTIGPDPQTLTVQVVSGNEFRIVSNNNYALNNQDYTTANGYAASNRTDYNIQSFYAYRVGDPQAASGQQVTVHYVDRYGNPLTGVGYTGSNTRVTANADGTFTIPYNWNGMEGEVDLRSQFDFTSVIKGSESPAVYTYGSTHLDGKNASGTNLTYNGYVIDSVLTSSGNDLAFASDSGATYLSGGYENLTILGNRAYLPLNQFFLSDNVYANPSNNGSRRTYAAAGNKDIYVILDPKPGENAASVEGLNLDDLEAPDFSKTMDDNEDGTYTLSLKVDAHAVNDQEPKKANVLFIVDTSSSMRAITTGNRSRIMDTHDAVKNLGDRLLQYNENHGDDAIEVAMITFDGSVDTRLEWTTDQGAFDNKVNEYLRFYWLHTGTDWEDGLNDSLAYLNTTVDDDPTFVIFFTDGEPSQYTSFHGKGNNGNTNPVQGQNSNHDTITNGYPDFFSYFLSRESSKDEMRAIVNEGYQLYGIYAYNTTNEHYNSYNGEEDGAKMLHNAIRYGYDTTADLTGNLFFEATNTTALTNAFDTIFNSITESVGFSNLVVNDGIASEVTSTTVIDGDVSAFTYTIYDKEGALAYRVTVAPNGVPEGHTVLDGTPIFTLADGSVKVGEKKTVPVTKVRTDSAGNPVTSGGVIQTDQVNTEVYYYKDTEADREYIMPICSPGSAANNKISWDLSPLGMLKDGYSYQVDFVVWPNQDSYDLVADLNNGNLPEGVTEDWTDLDWYEKDGKRYQIGGISGYPYIARYENGIYSALSNTEQYIKYYKVDNKVVNGEETVIFDGPKTTEKDPPPPMPLIDRKVKVQKVWNDSLDPVQLNELVNKNEESYQVELVLQRADEDYIDDIVIKPVKDDEENVLRTWPEKDDEGHDVEHYISAGLMVSEAEAKDSGLYDSINKNPSKFKQVIYNNTKYFILEPGYNYQFAENSLDSHFELENRVYHPMVVDGTLMDVTFSGNTISTMVSMEGVANTLTASNTLKAGININKELVDIADTQRAYLDTDEYFTVKVTLKDKDNEPVFDTTDGGGAVGYRIFAPAEIPEGAEVIPEDAEDDEVTGYTINEVTYNADKTEGVITGFTARGLIGTNGIVTLKIRECDHLRIVNVPAGTTYTVEEIEDTSSDFKFKESYWEVKKDGAIYDEHSATEDERLTVTHLIVSNAENNVIFRNKPKVLTREVTLLKPAGREQVFPARCSS